MKASKTLQYVVIGLTVIGLCVLFTMLVPVSAGAMFSLMCLVVLVAFSMHYLFSYINSPDIPEKVNKAMIYIHPFKDEAQRLALNELDITKEQATISCTYDVIEKCSKLWVTDRKTRKESRVYYYKNQKDNRS